MLYFVDFFLLFFFCIGIDFDLEQTDPRLFQNRQQQQKTYRDTFTKKKKKQHTFIYIYKTFYQITFYFFSSCVERIMCICVCRGSV